MPPRSTKKTVTPKAVKSAVSDVDADGRKQPTPGEAFLFYTIIKNMNNKPDIDWAAVAVDNKFKNAETAKVRFGQVRRKLGVDNWNTGGRVKDEDDGDDGAPDTPTAARTKKATKILSTGAGTGAGVKKRAGTSARRAAATPATGRSRKAKSQALVKLEEDANELLEDIYDDDETVNLSTPTQDKGNGGKKNGTKRAIKSEYGGGHHDTRVNQEYANFPEVLPEAVIQRKAILVNVCGNWTVSPADYEAQSQWLARLPALVQTRFYSQAAEAKQATEAKTVGTTATTGTGAGTKKNDHGSGYGDGYETVYRNGYANGYRNLGFKIDHHLKDPETATQAQLLSTNFGRELNAMQGLSMPISGLGMPMNMPITMNVAASMGYMPTGTGGATAASPGFGFGNRQGNGNGNGHGADMNSFTEQMEQRDQELLFGGGAHDHEEDEC